MESLAKDGIGDESGFRFVGRKEEFNALALGLEDARSGHGRLFSLVGEPGIGKTRLAAELVSLARERGAETIWASTFRGGGPEFWLWNQVLGGRSLASLSFETTDSQMAEFLSVASQGVDTRELVRSPNATQDRRAVSSLPALSLSLFRATMEHLLAISVARPLLIVLDDVAAADHLSLLTLRFIASRLPEMPVIIVTTYREADAWRSAAVSELLNEAVPNNRLLALAPLSTSEVSELIEARTAEKPAEALTKQVAFLTRGNPLFVELVLRENYFLENVDETNLALPHAIKVAAEKHLGPIPQISRRILSIATVIGNEFDLASLRAVSECSTPEIFDSLSEGRRAALLNEDESTPGGYRFSQPLLRQALYDSLPDVARARLHHRVAQFLEKTFKHDRARLYELAHHFYAGVSVSDEAQKALEYCQQAASEAIAASKYKVASRLYGMGLAAVNLGGFLSEPSRCDLLLQLADAQARAGESSARQTFGQAFALAETLGDPESLAQSALGYVGPTVVAPSRPDGQTVSMLKKALDLLGERDGLPKVRLLLRLAWEVSSQAESQTWRQGLEREAEEIARRLADARTTFALLLYRYLVLLSDPQKIDEQAAVYREMLRLATEGGRAEDCITALACRRVWSLCTEGRVRLHAEAYFFGFADRVMASYLLEKEYTYHAAVVALLEGRFEGSAALTLQCLEVANWALDAYGPDFLWPALIVPFCELGRLQEVERFSQRSIERYPRAPIFRALQMNIHLLLQRTRQARQEFETLALCDFEDLPRDAARFASLSLLAEACAELGDARRAALLHELLRPFGKMNAAFGPLAFFGPASRYLGLLTAAMGKFDEAEVYFEDALRSSEKLSALPWIAYTKHDYAKMLLERGDSIAASKSLELAMSALQTAEDLGMQDLKRRLSCLTVQRELKIAVSKPSPTAAVAVAYGEVGPEERLQSQNGTAPERVFVKRGDYWTIVFSGKVFHLKHSRGLAYIAHLLRYPGRDFHVLELAASVDGESAETLVAGPAVVHSEELRTRRAGEDDSAPVLDRQAKVAYNERIEDLRHELEEAKSFNDLGRVSRIEGEISRLATELSRAMGFGGRWDRKLGSDSERARVSVTNAVRATIKKIRQEDPELARHLATMIRTGRFCSYGHDSRLSELWQV